MTTFIISLGAALLAAQITAVIVSAFTANLLLVGIGSAIAAGATYAKLNN